MKKIILIVSILFFLAGAAMTAYVFLHQKTERIAIDSVLPANPLIYIKVNQLTKNLQKITSGQLWKTIEDLDYDVLIENGKGTNSFLKVAAEYMKKLSDPATVKLLDIFFGEEAAIAMYQGDIDLSLLINPLEMDLSKFLLNVFSNAYLVTRASENIQMIEFLTKYFGQFQKNISFKTIEYLDYTVHIAALSEREQKMYFVLLEDLLVVSLSQRTIQAAIQVYQQEEAALSRDPAFMTANSNIIDAAGMSGFVKLEEVLKLTVDQAKLIFTRVNNQSSAEEIKAVNQNIDEFVKSFAGYRMLSVSMKWDPLFQAQTNLFYDLNKFDSKVASFYSACQSVKNETIHFVPKDALAYHWSACLGLGAQWEAVQEELAKSSDNLRALQTQKKIDEFEQSTGLSIENDILDAFADQYGGFLYDINKSQPIPVPEMAIFIKIKDKAKAENIISRLTKQPMFAIEQEMYKEYSFKYIVLPFGQSVRPSYGFLDDYLFVAVNTDVIRKSIYAKTEPALSLLASEKFKKVDFGLTEKNTNVQYASINEIAVKINSLVELAHRWIRSQAQQQQAFRAGARLKLDDTHKELDQERQLFENTAGRKKILSDQIYNAEINGESVSVEKSELEQLNAGLEVARLKIDELAQEKVRLEKTLQDFKGRGMSAERKQIYVDEFISPLLKGLESIKAYGSRVRSESDMLEGALFLDVQENQ